MRTIFVIAIVLMLLADYARSATVGCPKITRSELDALLRKENKTTNIYFFASWCGECSKNLKNSTDEDILIAAFDRKKSAEKVVNKLGVKGRCFTDDGVAESYEIMGVPAKVTYEKTAEVAKPQSLLVSAAKATTLGDLNYRIVDIIQDSRCPVDVMCVQAGSVTALVEIASKTLKKTYQLEIPGPGVEAKDFALSVAGVLVKPPRSTKTKIEKNQYEIEFNIIP